MLNSILEFTSKLINIPSQGGIDYIEDTLFAINQWLSDHQINSRYLHDIDNNIVAVLVEIKNKIPGPHYCFNACADTAPFGDIKRWKYSPTSSMLIDGFLFGRGASDSKIGVSIFSHIAKALNEYNGNFAGQIDFLFDADEHTGNFTGIESYIKNLNGKKIDGVFIGYPGNDDIKIGARGFLRLKLVFNGEMEHTGSKNISNNNAIIKANLFITKLNNASITKSKNAYFTYGPKITITKICGGDGFSVLPSECCVYLDIRLTPDFEKQNAYDLISILTDEIDLNYDKKYSTRVFEYGSIPAYKTNENLEFVRTLKHFAESEFQRTVECVVCGPSNIGNFLALHGINSTCGFGVTYNGMHSYDESIDINTILPIYNIYLSTILSLSKFDKVKNDAT